MKKVKAPASKKKTATKKQKVAAAPARTKTKAKTARSTTKPTDYLVLIFCGRSYKSVITALVTTVKKEAQAEAKWLASRVTSEKGDKVDIAVFNADYSWDDEQGWEFFS